ncbi:MAG: hypothetical protein V2A79_19430 [Planctomycetota bacterium]
MAKTPPAALSGMAKASPAAVGGMAKLANGERRHAQACSLFQHGGAHLAVGLAMPPIRVFDNEE